MKNRVARRWFGLYFLIAAFSMGAYLLIFAGTKALPLSADQSSDCFKIIIPVLIGQVAIIFQWLSTANNNDAEEVSSLPVWAIVLPPILSVLIILLAAIALVVANDEHSTMKMGPENFKQALTFSVTLLNATAIYFVAKLFPKLCAPIQTTPDPESAKKI